MAFFLPSLLLDHAMLDRPVRVQVPVREVLETKDAVTVSLELPGFGPEEVVVQLNEDVLHIQAGQQEQQTTTLQHKDKLHHRPRRTFSRCLRVPEGVDHDHISVTLQHGILEITLPKLPPPPKPQPRRILINQQPKSAEQLVVDTAADASNSMPESVPAAA